MASIAFLGLAALPAAAMPVAPLNAMPHCVTLVAWGCGPGWTRGPYGHCHPRGFVARGPAYGFYARPYAPYPYYARRCWWRAGVRICN
jgi:hypothetical protein